MKSSDIKLGVNYAVIPAWDYSSMEKKDANKVQRRYIAKAELVNLDKYEYKVFRFDSPDNPNFQPAPKGARSVGYLVKSHDWNSSAPTYWLARPQDIVAEYATLENRWANEEREEAERRAKELAEREANERKAKDVLANEQRKMHAVQLAFKTIIGERANGIRFDINNRRNANGDYLPTGEITLDLRTAQLLVERMLEARESVA